jgi:TRAP-type C4-dicarboxylate transport system permease small subunit
MKVWLDRLESRGVGVARFAALFGMIGLVGFVLMTNADVLMRWLFNSPLNYIADVAPLVMAIVVAALFPFAIAARYHVTIELLGGLIGRRAQAWLEVFAALVGVVFFALVAWQIVLFTIDLHVRGQTTWVMQIPSAPWWVVASVFMVLCVLVQLIVLVVQFRRAATGAATDEDRPASPGETPASNGAS